MNKIFMRGDYGAHIHVDGTLIDDLRKVALATEVGNIRVKNLTADAISLSSQIGDISLDGIIDGHVIGQVRHQRLLHNKSFYNF